MAGLFSKLRFAATPKPLEPASIIIGAGEIGVMFKRHAQARRMVLRLNAEGTAVVVTVPSHASRIQAIDFTERSRGWIEQKLAAHGGSTPMTPGNRIPLRGSEHEIVHVPSRRGTVTSDPLAGVIRVPGEVPHVPRRLLDWLKTTARAELTSASRKYAALMGVKFSRVTIRDQRSRWGSCSAAGELSYSWRLILTPPHVLDYVAAHEAAHLKHMNHGRHFWRLVLTHCPDAAKAKKWLKANGQSVHRIAV